MTTFLFVACVVLCTAALACYSRRSERTGNWLTAGALFCLVLGFGIWVAS